MVILAPQNETVYAIKEGAISKGIGYHEWSTSTFFSIIICISKETVMIPKRQDYVFEEQSTCQF